MNTCIFLLLKEPGETSCRFYTRNPEYLSPEGLLVSEMENVGHYPFKASVYCIRVDIRATIRVQLPLFQAAPRHQSEDQRGEGKSADGSSG